MTTDAAAAALPRYQVEYWQPASAIADSVSGYSRHHVVLAAGDIHRDILFPGWFNLRCFMRGNRFRIDGVQIPYPALCGPVGRALPVETGSGTLLNAGITPLGWYRLSRVPAGELSDQIVPAAAVLAGVDDLTAALAPVVDDPLGIRAAFDGWFTARLQPRAGEERITAIHALLLADDIGSVTEAAARLDLSPRLFHKLCRSAFGFGPKLLLRRARFLRTLQWLREPSDLPWSARIHVTYFDQSHFIRECRYFLNMSPSEFLHHIHPLNDASAHARATALGAPVQALQGNAA